MTCAPFIHLAERQMSPTFAAKGAAGQTPARVTIWGLMGLLWSREYER